MAMLGAFDEVLSARRRIAELVQKNTQQTRKVRELRLKLERTQAGMEHELARLRERESLCAEQLAKANELRAWSERGPALETENRELHDMLEEALDLQTAQEARIKALTEELERTRDSARDLSGRLHRRRRGMRCRMPGLQPLQQACADRRRRGAYGTSVPDTCGAVRRYPGLP